MDFKQKNRKGIKIATKQDIPEGKAIIVTDPQGTEIALFKIDNEIFAIENVCPHRGGPVGEGEIDNGAVTCPWHGWQFDIKTAECLNVPGESASQIPINIDGDDIYLVD